MPIFDELIRRESPFYVLGAKPPVISDLRSLIPTMEGATSSGDGMPAVSTQRDFTNRTAPPNIMSEFDNIRSGTAGPAPAMSAVTSNPRLLAEDARADRVRGILQKLRSTGTGSPAQAANYQEQMLAEAGSTSPLGYSTNIRPPVDPPAPSESGRTGKRGSAGYQADRNMRLAILNEQERNRQPSPAEFTLNENNLPAELAKVYADRKSLQDKRVALAEQFPLNIPAPAYDDQAKAAMAKQYTDRGFAVPGVYSPIASPEKVAADKAARAADEKRRFDNWSMREQAAGLTNRLGLPPIVSTMMAAENVGRDYGGNVSPFINAAAYGPQGAAVVERQRLENQGAIDARNAARGGLAPEQAAGLAAARAMIESGDPMAIQQGVQMVRQYLGRNPGMQPSAVPAPGTPPELAHAVSGRYSNQQLDDELQQVFDSVNKSRMWPDSLGWWNKDGATQAFNEAVRHVAGKAGVPIETARQYVHDWYKKNHQDNAWLFPAPDVSTQ